MCVAKILLPVVCVLFDDHSKPYGNICSAIHNEHSMLCSTIKNPLQIHTHYTWMNGSAIIPTELIPFKCIIDFDPVESKKKSKKAKN